MKRFLIFFALLATAAAAYGQATPSQYPYPKPLGTTGATPAGGGVKRSSPFQPAAYDQDAPITWDAVVGGGYRSVATTTERDNINAQWRKEGMLVWVAADGKTYRLGSDLVTWNQVSDLGSAGLGSGTVTSVNLSMPGTYSVSGSPITTSGTISVSYATQAANQIFAGPTSGAAASPTFRSMVQADIPIASIDLQRMANMASASFIGRSTTGTGVPQVLNSTAATAILNVMTGDSGAGGVKGLVPAPAAGDATRFLRGDGTFAAVTATANNMANANLTLTGNRVHSGAGFNWDFQNVNFLTLGGTNVELYGTTYLTLGSPTELQISPPSVWAGTAKVGQVLKLTQASLGDVEFGDPWTVKNPSFSTTINTDCADGTQFIVVITPVSSDFTIANPTNPRNGQTIRFRIKSNSTGGWVVNWASKFKFSADMSGTPALLPSKTMLVWAEYDSVDDVWRVGGVNNGF